MKLLFQQYLRRDRQYHDMGIIDTEGGEIQEAIDDGFEDWVKMEFSKPTTPEMDQTDELLRTYDGPYLVANPIEDES